MDKLDKKRLNLEIKILKNTYHYNIIKLYDVIETNDTICMIMEYAEGGELTYSRNLSPPTPPKLYI